MANNMLVDDPSNKGVDAFMNIDSSIASCFPWLARILPLFVAIRFPFGFCCLDISYDLLIISKASTTIL
jgi:hypothetical protein